MNPRIQVEHTVTEEVTDVDLVQSQLRIASGETLADLGLSQDTIVLRGAALQCRITTEDPANNFRPDTGVITTYRSPGGAGVRVDGGTTYTGRRGLGALRLDAGQADLSRPDLRQGGREGAARGGGVPDPRRLHQHRVPPGRAGRPRLRRRPRHHLVHRDPPAAAAGARLRRPRQQAADLPGRRHRQPAARPGAGEHRPGHQAAPTSTSTCPRPTAAASCCSRSGRRSSPGGCARRTTVAVTDTTFRDAHQSLLATRVRTRDLLAVAGHVARTTPQLWSLEAWGGATYDVALRFLAEDPWERLAALRQAVPNICLQMLLRGRNTVGYTPYPTEVTTAFVEEAAATGIDVFRIFDALNDVEQMRPAIEAVRATGTTVAEVALCYTGDLSDPGETALHPRLLPAPGRADRRRRRPRARDQGHGRAAAGARRPHPGHRAARALRPAGAPAHPRHPRRPAGDAARPRSTPASTRSTPPPPRWPARPRSRRSRRSSRRPTTPRARPGSSLAAVNALEPYWEATRRVYAPFESGLPAPTGRVYRHEIPGGQLSNLRQQAIALGLGEKFEQVEDMYAAANDILGNVVKVTPVVEGGRRPGAAPGRRSAPTRRSSPRTPATSTSPTR